MKRICKYCGKEYDGDPGSSACPECAERVKKSVVRTRVCRECGREFPGGPRAWYCPECRANRRREADARHKRAGTQRPIGSVDKCLVCGADYVVKSARQRYCQSCAEEAVKKVDRAQSTAWNRENTTPEQRKAHRKAAAAEIMCVICGRMFIPTSAAITCSPECSMELAKRNTSEYEKQNRAYRNQYHRDRASEKEANMSPDEYRAYRDGVNAKARKNYRKRRAKSMTKEQIVASANIIARLQKALGNAGADNIDDIAAFPFKTMLRYNREAFDKQVLTDDTQVYLTEQYSCFSAESIDAWADKPLDDQDRKIWREAYQEAAKVEGVNAE